MNINRQLLLMSGLLLAGGAAEARITYPKTAKVDVYDEYFGTRVADPYRWLENDTSAETAKWVKAENEITHKYLNQIPFREALKKRFNEVYKYERVGAMIKHNGKYYFFKNNGLQNQNVLYEQASLTSEPHVFFDPNALAADGTVALRSISFSNDGKYFAYVIARSGSDWNEIYVRDLTTGKLLDDHIMWAKFTGVAWHGDGFYYSAYDAPKEGFEYSSKNEYHKVFYHKIGTPQSADRLEFENKSNPLLFHQAEVSDDEHFIFMYESKGHGNTIFVKDLTDPNASYKLILDNPEAECGVIGTDSDFIYVQTNDGAPKGKVLAMPVNNICKDNFCTLIPEGKYVLAGIQQAGDKFIVSYEIDACTQPYLYERNGKLIRKIDLPGLGDVSISSSPRHNEVFYGFTSFTTPGSLYSYDIATGKSSLYYQAKVDFDCDAYTTEQVTFKSKDGTPIRMFLVHRKGIKRDGKNPVLVYGYGGFNVSVNPSFTTSVLPFLENGGIYAVVNLRGGSEYGEEWHQAGTKMNKQNVFDDFIAAAEYLIREKYTTAKRMACRGGSNGGLLIGAVVNQRPDLYGAAVAQVGVMDMLRYHKFTIGWNWAGDYGTSADSKEMFEYLYKYSPLHNIKNDGTPYPPVLITTGDHDDRVVPAHSFKYAATLQAADTGNAPKLIRIDSKAGHGGGKPITKVIDEQTDIFSFIMQNLGIKFKAKK